MKSILGSMVSGRGLRPRFRSRTAGLSRSTGKLCVGGTGSSLRAGETIMATRTPHGFRKNLFVGSQRQSGFSSLTQSILMAQILARCSLWSPPCTLRASSLLSRKKFVPAECAGLGISVRSCRTPKSAQRFAVRLGNSDAAPPSVLSRNSAAGPALVAYADQFAPPPSVSRNLLQESLTPALAFTSHSQTMRTLQPISSSSRRCKASRS